MKQKRRHGHAGHGRRLLEIGKDILIVFLVLVNVALAIMCLPTKRSHRPSGWRSALRPFAGLFGLNEAERPHRACHRQRIHRRGAARRRHAEH